jgi:2-keto-4-pentenoate hydratase/2-oxohepta-3-ene-1,7-dioic acid hydratase in catechol pathway
MKVVTFERNRELRLGVVEGNRILDIKELSHLLKGRRMRNEMKKSDRLRSAAGFLSEVSELPQDMISLLQNGRAWLKNLGKLASITTHLALEKKSWIPENLFLRLDSTRLRSPILQPPKIICVGRNYSEHARESGHAPPANPIFFSKPNSAICDPGRPIRLPSISQQVDYEAELAVVIGRRGYKIPVEKAHEYIAGYTLTNDVSARDMQEADGQWFRAKSCDTFAPLGPWIVTADEIDDAHHLRITLTLNGQVMQDSNTSNLIFKIPFLISYLSNSMTWEVGDILATGTPPGVGLHRTPPVFLKPGDTVSVSVQDVGTLKNTVVDSEKRWPA